MAGARVSFAVAGEAMRAAIVKAATEKLVQSEWRALGAVLVLLPSYSRIEDEAYVAQIAALANLAPRTTRRALTRLDELGIISYDGRRGPGRKPLISLPRIAAETGQHGGQSETGLHAGHSTPLDWPPSRPPDWPPSRPTTEKDLREEDVDVWLEQELNELSLTLAQLARAREPGDRDRVRNWIDRSKLPGIDNRAGFVWNGIKSGEWPSWPKTPDAAPEIDLHEAWTRFLDGHGWDDAYTEREILLELHSRRAKFPGALTDTDALALWQAARTQRYPIEATA